MPDRTKLGRLGKLVAADIGAERLGPDTRSVSDFLQAQPEAVLDLLDMLVAETGRKRQNEELVAAYAFMVGQALEFTRYRMEAGEADAAELVGTVRRQLLAMSKDGAEPVVLLIALRAFADAKLDPGPELRDMMGRLAGEAADMPGQGGIEALDSHLEELARAVGGDPFGFYDQVREMADALPEEHRAAMGAWLLQSGETTAREAAVGWLLDPAPSVRDSVASGMAGAAAPDGVSDVMLRRMAALRFWLPESDRPSLDRAIEACYAAGRKAAPWQQSQIREVVASGIDGAGAQSIFIVAREGRRSAIGCILLKHGIGVRDAWARHALTRSEVGEFMTELQEVDLFPISLDYVAVAIAHALAGNLVSGVLPPFALLDALEVAGLEGIQPRALSLEDVLDRLGADADPGAPRAEAAELLAGSSTLPETYGFLDSWFEADTEPQRMLADSRLSRARRIDLVRDELLPRHAGKWAERFAWTALTLRHARTDLPWQAFHVSARELNSGRPMSEIPLIGHIATLTVDACMAAHREGQNPAARRRR